MKKTKIVFFGTPEFAVPSLKVLVERKENILCVVTQPDKPVGRGQKLKFSPVKELALENGYEKILAKVKQYDHETNVDAVMDSIAAGSFDLQSIIDEALGEA